MIITVTDAVVGLNGSVVGSLTLDSSEGRGNDIFMDSSYAYLATETSLKIIDITTPSSPSVVGTYLTPTGGYVSDVTVVGNTAYIVDTDSALASTLYVLDITTKNNPTNLGSIVTAGTAATALRVEGDYAYVSDGNGITAYTITNPASIVQGSTATLPSNDGYKMDINSSHAFIATNSGMKIIELGGANPTVVDDLSSNDFFFNTDIAYSSGYAYLAADSEGIRVYNVSNPASPSIETTFLPTDAIAINSLSVSGNTLYAAYSTNSTEEVAIIDITNPTLPTVESTVVIGTLGQGIASNGSFVGVAENSIDTYKAFELIEVTGQ